MTLDGDEPLRFESVWVESEEDEDTGLPGWIEGDSLAPFVPTPGEHVDSEPSCIRVTPTALQQVSVASHGSLPTM